MFMFYIGETQATLSKAFDQKLPSEKPVVSLRDVRLDFH